jgi:hypothetical protein
VRIAEGKRAVAHRRTKTRKVLWRIDDVAPEELLVFCPGCKTLEVVRFSSEGLIATRKFTQRADKVFHSCDSGAACRLHGQAGHTVRTQPARSMSSRSLL